MIMRPRPKSPTRPMVAMGAFGWLGVSFTEDRLTVGVGLGEMRGVEGTGERKDR